MSREHNYVPSSVLEKLSTPTRDLIDKVEAVILEYLPEDDREKITSHLYIGHLIAKADPAANVTIIRNKKKKHFRAAIGIAIIYPTIAEILPHYLSETAAQS